MGLGFFAEAWSLQYIIAIWLVLSPARCHGAHRLWQVADWAGLQVNGRAVSFAEPLLSYKFMLPRTQLKAGIAYAGARFRMRRFLRDLLSGHRSLKVGLVGGSNSWGVGASAVGSTDWFALLARWLVDAFPRAHISARNGAVPGTNSSYMIACAELSVDPDVDLLLLEYGAEDGFEDRVLRNGVVRTRERLLRRLLALPAKPAVVVLQIPSSGWELDSGEEASGGSTGGTTQQRRQQRQRQLRGFYRTGEDVAASLAHYYDVPYLSLRAALYGLAAVERREGWLWRDVFTGPQRDQLGDVGAHAAADLVAHLMQATAFDLLVSDTWGAADVVAQFKPLPPPMYPDNLPPDATMCAAGESLRPLVTAAQGFTWQGAHSGSRNGGSTTTTATTTAARTTDVSAASVAPPGWGGYWANWSAPAVERLAPRLVVRLDTRRPPPLLGADQSVPLHLHYLRAADGGMGKAEISCSGGCSCVPLVVDGHSPPGQSAAQVALARVNVSQSPACEVTVTLLLESSSGGRSFKVSGVVASEAGGEGPDGSTVLDRLVGPADQQQAGRTGSVGGRLHMGELAGAVYRQTGVAVGTGSAVQ